MNVSCPDCHSVFRVDPAKIPAGGVRARCSVCGGVMPVDAPRGERAMAHAVAAEPSRSAAPQSPALAAAVHAGTPSNIASVHSTPGMFAAPAVATPGLGTPGTLGTATPGDALPATGSPSPLVAPALGAAPPEPPPVVAAPLSAAPGSASMPPLAPSQPVYAPTPPAVDAAPPVPAPTPAPGASSGAEAAGSPRPPINPFLSNDPGQKARRLARALVSDMVTYHPTLREQALREGTIKQLFKEEIKKSYEEYVEQVGHEFAESTSHFQDALNDILAGGRQVF